MRQVRVPCKMQSGYPLEVGHGFSLRDECETNHMTAKYFCHAMDELPKLIILNKYLDLSRS